MCKKRAHNCFSLLKNIMPKEREYTVEERANVVTLREQGHSYREIQCTTKIAFSACHDIYKKFQSTGSTANRKRLGPPIKFTSPIKKRIATLVKRQPNIVSREIAEDLTKNFGRKFSKSARRIRSIRKAMGYIGSMGIPQEVLTDTHKEKRIHYCNQHRKDYFSNVIWSDEKPWGLYKRRQLLWRIHGRIVPKRPTTKYQPILQCWGAISP
eukprot:TRINITY_DN4920_c0_g2_i1.p1 TRINITY_DN4920_c0_g2~~TRINITY_DN4920_c0_g2_i1.p1  ORF type:complete len:211 (+),score=8.91 TRINITY_DN4920_c0_g2_i1:243-875(+)